jgi:hypothetical protein
VVAVASPVVAVASPVVAVASPVADEAAIVPVIWVNYISRGFDLAFLRTRLQLGNVQS